MASVGFGDGLLSLLREDARETLEVVSHGFEGEFQLVLYQTDVAHSHVVLPLLQVCKDTLNAATHAALAPVLCAIVFGELDVVRALLGNLAVHAMLAQPGCVGFGIVGFVSIEAAACIT